MNHSRKRESSVRDARQKTSWTIHFLFFVASHFCFLQSVFCCKQAIYFLPLLLIFVSKKFAPKYFCFHKKKKIQDISCSLLQVISVGSNPFFFFAIVVDFCFKKFCTQVFLLSQKNKLTTFCFHKKKKMDSTPHCSRVVPHPSTERAQTALTSVFGWEPVDYGWYGRIQLSGVKNESKFLLSSRFMLGASYFLLRPIFCYSCF